MNITAFYFDFSKIYSINSINKIECILQTEKIGQDKFSKTNIRKNREPIKSMFDWTSCLFDFQPLEYPDFGLSDAEDEIWQEFYAFFSAYVTPRSYAWVDKYDTRQADNRRVARLMEKENKKVGI